MVGSQPVVNLYYNVDLIAGADFSPHFSCLSSLCFSFVFKLKLFLFSFRS